MLENITNFFGTLSPFWFYLALFACAYYVQVVGGKFTPAFGGYIADRFSRRHVIALR
jgi:hypothetical protein